MPNIARRLVRHSAKVYHVFLLAEILPTLDHNGDPPGFSKSVWFLFLFSLVASFFIFSLKKHLVNIHCVMMCVGVYIT